MLLAGLMAAQPDNRPSRQQRSRNAEILCAVLRESEARLRMQARRHCELATDIEDALQSAYALFLERYNGVGEPMAWLYTTVKREAWALGRRADRRCARSNVVAATGSGASMDLFEMLPTDSPGPAERAARNSLTAARLRSLAELKPDERRALWLLGLGYSYAEISELTGWTHTKINRCLSEGRVALRRMEQRT